jgi:hypothetical protein
VKDREQYPIPPDDGPPRISRGENRVLRDAGRAMHYIDMAYAIVAQKLRAEVGPTPVNTVAAVLSRVDEAG